MKKNILIITSSIDATVDYIIQRYNHIAIFYRLNIDQFSDYAFNIGTNANWTISCSQWSIKEVDIYSIYYRKPLLPDLTGYEDFYRTMISRDIISIINGIADSFSGKVLTKPSLLRKTENKTFQLLYARKNNIVMPESYIGNNRASSNISGLKIIKPLTTGKISIANRTEIYQTSYINEISEDISLTPIYIQHYEAKAYEVRLTYIDGIIFAVRINSPDKLDWRKNYDKLTYSLIDCPLQIKTVCRKLMKDWSLCFGAFDFIVSPSGKWIFLEINPNGQWLWLEYALNIPISEQIIKYLTN